MVSEWKVSRAEFDRARLSIGGGVASSTRASWRPHPLSFESGRGPRIVDVEGNSYLDYVLGWGPLLLGHTHPRLTAAAHEQLDRGILFGSGSRAEVDAAEKLLSALGWAERLVWSNSGTEAVQIALRLARAHTGRDVVIKLGGAYHGWHDTVLAGYHHYGNGGAAVPNSKGQPASALSDLRVGLYNDLARTRELLTAEAGRVAAILVDPTSSNTGSVVPAPGYLEGLRALADEHGALLIFDEVVSGLRLGTAGAAGLFGVTPDLATFGKAIGGGFPISAVAGRGDLVDLVVRGAVHSGTFNGNPLATTAVSTVLDVLTGDDAYPSLERTAELLVDGLRDAVKTSGYPISIHHLGATVMVGPGLTEITGPDDFLAGDWAWWTSRFAPAMLSRGIYLLPGGRLFLSVAHGPAEVGETVAAFAGSLAEVPAPTRV
jgi:glutamate-1-semialdehyde 2,1-aminomutase